MVSNQDEYPPEFIEILEQGCGRRKHTFPLKDEPLILREIFKAIGSTVYDSNDGPIQNNLGV